MKVAFLSSEFGWDFQNVKNTIELAEQITSILKVTLLIPHLYLPQFIDKKDEDLGSKMCEDLLRKSDFMIVGFSSPEGIISPGMRMELKQCLKENKKVFLFYQGLFYKLDNFDKDKIDLPPKIVPEKDLLKSIS